MLTTIAAKRVAPLVPIVLGLSFSPEKKTFFAQEVEELVPLDTLLASVEAHIVLYPELVPFLQEVSSPSVGNGFFVERVLPELVGNDFFEALVLLKEQKNWLLLGVQRGERVHTNPHRLILQPEDRLFVLRENA